MIDNWRIPIPSITGKKPRNIWVYVPDDAEETDKHYPVLYMMDGHNLFFDEVATYGKCWGLKEYMEETETPVIIVGIDCNHQPNHGRLSEYSPYTFQDDHFGRIYGRGKLFMDWLCGTLKPLIDERYPTMPERETTWMAGSSMGGLITLYGLTAYNHVFSRGAALSPSVWTSPKKLNRLICETEYDPDTLIYMDYGSCELDNHEGMQPLFTRTAANLMNQGVKVTVRIIPGGQHCEACWEEQVPFFMNTLLYEYGG